MNDSSCPFVTDARPIALSAHDCARRRKERLMDTSTEVISTPPSALQRALYRFSSGRPLRIISDDGKPYLERYFLFRILGITAYMHRFVGSDPDRGLHDHPWSWALSVILYGSYTEQLEGRERRVRWLNWLRGTTYHRVLLDHPNDEVWTIFIHRAKRSKTWGFRNAPGEEKRVASSPGSNEWWFKVPVGRNHPMRVPQRPGR
jgi:hypothetical protein